MSKANNLTDFLTDVADAIRYSADITDNINPQLFSDEIKKLKLSGINVNLVSNTEVSGDSLTSIRIKQSRLTSAINGTVIDGETVYKITQQINDNANSSTDTIFYTKEGDAGKYYYVLSSIDNFLNKIKEVVLKEYYVLDTATNTTYGPYTFEDGMTFADLFNSDYTNRFAVGGGITFKVPGKSGGFAINDLTGNQPYSPDKIQAITYTTNSNGVAEPI